MVVASKAGVALERVRSTTCIVHAVPSEYDDAVRKANVVITATMEGNAKITIVRSLITAPQGFVDGVAVNGAAGVWVSRNTYAVWTQSEDLWVYHFDDDHSGAYGVMMGRSDLPSAHTIQSYTANFGTKFTWTGTLPASDYFESDD